MDPQLYWEIQAISKDDRSGAAEITLRAVCAVDEWLRRCPKPTKNQLLDLTCQLLQTHHAMAPLQRLANAVALAAEARNREIHLRASCNDFRRILRIAPRAIAVQFKAAIAKGPKKDVVTFSYSSTVLRALIHSRARLERVWCAEGRPAYEGRQMARRLAKAGIRVMLSTDAGIFKYLVDPKESHTILVLGADQIGLRGFVNKTGTDALVCFAKQQKAPQVILADTLKFMNRRKAALPTISRTNGRRVWETPPKGVHVCDSDFCITSYPPGMRILTEKGWLTISRLRREVRKVRFSPWMERLFTRAWWPPD